MDSYLQTKHRGAQQVVNQHPIAVRLCCTTGVAASQLQTYWYVVVHSPFFATPGHLT